MVQGSEIVGSPHKPACHPCPQYGRRASARSEPFEVSPACHARRENTWKGQVIGAVQGMVEETNRCQGTSGQVKHFLAYEQGQRKEGNPESRFHRETLNL